MPRRRRYMNDLPSGYYRRADLHVSIYRKKPTPFMMISPASCAISSGDSFAPSLSHVSERFRLPDTINAQKYSNFCRFSG